MFSFHRVDIGPRCVDIPVADFRGHAPGKTLLVTAGMDGDEYASIEAAYRLAEEFSTRAFVGRLVVVPLVNIMGFWNECSQNPLDGLFPKMRLLGKEGGSSTERLTHWLSSHYALQADCWYDAHGGAMTEGLHPFLWAWRGPRTSELVSTIRDARLADVFVDERAHFGSGASLLAKHGCAYMIGESGQRGRREEADIARHTTWVHGVMHAMGMLDDVASPAAQDVYSRVAFVTARTEGIWRPAHSSLTVTKGEVLGECVGIDGRLLHTVRAPSGGVRLWWKETMALRKGDVLCAIAH